MSSSPTLRRFAGRPQALIERASDLEALAELDPAHWVISTAPCQALSCSEALLGFLDQDGDGQIQSQDVLETLAWWRARMADPSGLLEGSSLLQRSALSQSSESGRLLAASATRVLENLGQSDSPTLTLSQLRDRTKMLQAGAQNGDGVIPLEAIQEAPLRRWAEAVILATGGEQGADGRVGLSESCLRRFQQEGPRWLAWRAGEAAAKAPALERIGSGVPAAWAKTAVVRERVEDYFQRCALRAASGEDDQTSGPSDRPPFAYPQSELRLDRSQWIHPEHRAAWRDFQQAVLTPAGLLEGLRYQDWVELLEALDCYGSWATQAPTGGWGELGPERIRACLEDRDAVESIQRLMQRDRAVAGELSGVADLEKLLILQRDLKAFLNCFVDFSRFYDPRERSSIEQGSLLMDGRWFHLTLHVQDRAAHKEHARRGFFCLLYVRVQPSDGKAFEIAAAVTGQRRGGLELGKRGVFVDRSGRSSPAQVVDILEHPIHASEAFLAPFRSLKELLRGQWERFTSSRTQELESALKESMEGVHETPEETAAAEQPPPESSSSSLDPRAIWMGGGVTLAALSSSFAYIVQTLTAVHPLELLAVLGSPLLALALGGAIATWWKVRHRDLAPVLEASGWAVNHPLPVPSWAGPVFTSSPRYPEGTRRLGGPDRLRSYRRMAPSPARSRGRLLFLFLLLGASLAWLESSGVWEGWAEELTAEPAESGYVE